MRAIPTNIITGFLGVGKTSLILHLLRSKPADQRWAVLVNEFGEIGVDGSLYEAQNTQDQGIYVREVPGGCMCCAAGVPMTVAFNQLLKKAKPDHVLIEPTGLGHPEEIRRVLSSEPYRDVLALQKTLTLVDARKLRDKRYTTHDIFNQQIEIADIIVGNKSDLYQDEDIAKLKQYVQQINPTRHVDIILSKHGQIASELLWGQSQSAFQESSAAAHSHDSHSHDSHSHDIQAASDQSMPEGGFIKSSNKGEGFYSLGWRFSGKTVFSYAQVSALLATFHSQTERIKALFITDKGIVGFNGTGESVSEETFDQATESRIDVISARPLDEAMEAQLLACVLT